jgi:hypothetical protein
MIWLLSPLAIPSPVVYGLSFSVFPVSTLLMGEGEKGGGWCQITKSYKDKKVAIDTTKKGKNSSVWYGKNI